MGVDYSIHILAPWLSAGWGGGGWRGGTANAQNRLGQKPQAVLAPVLGQKFQNVLAPVGTALAGTLLCPLRRGHSCSILVV